MNQSLWQTIAKQKYPDYTVSGDGHIAVVLHCACRVVLCDWIMEAEDLVAKECMPHSCTHVALGPKFKMHRIEVLESRRVAAPAAESAFQLGWGD